MRWILAPAWESGTGVLAAQSLAGRYGSGGLVAWPAAGSFRSPEKVIPHHHLLARRPPPWKMISASVDAYAFSCTFRSALICRTRGSCADFVICTSNARAPLRAAGHIERKMLPSGRRKSWGGSPAGNGPARLTPIRASPRIDAPKQRSIPVGAFLSKGAGNHSMGGAILAIKLTLWADTSRRWC
jgi:hypothetical protein